MEYVGSKGRESCVVSVSVVGTDFTQDHTMYNLEVCFGECQWTVRRRYREFHSLHEKLVSTRGLAWELLPPKKLVGNLNPHHVERRRLLLEKYVQNLLSFFIELPAELMEFLEVDRFDVNSVCITLTRTLCGVGETLLAENRPVILSPLQLHCLKRRLLLPLPTCASGDPNQDIGHLYDFLHQLRYLKIRGGGIDDTFVGEHDLSFDFTIFKSLETLEIDSCCTDLIAGFGSLLSTLKKLKISKSLQQLKDILISSDQWTEGVIMEIKSGCEEDGLVPSYPCWDGLTVASFKDNDLATIDHSITLLKNVTHLDLSHNFLTGIQYLEALICLTDLNLSYNEINSVSSLRSKLGNIKRLNLASNLLKETKGLEKMYSLQKLDISNNFIEEICHIYSLCGLPLLDDLRIEENPLCREQDRRIRIFAQFCDRYTEVAIDGVHATKQEASKINELLLDMDSYEIIVDPFWSHDEEEEANISVPMPRKKGPIPTQKSPRQKKRDRVVPIGSPSTKGFKEDRIRRQEKEEEEFRKRMVSIQEKAGDSWLSVLNNIGERDRRVQDEVSSDNPEDKKEEHEVFCSEDDEVESDADDVAMELLVDLLRNRKRLGLPVDIKDEVDDLINNASEIIRDTFLILNDEELFMAEHVLNLDQDEQQLTEIDIVTGEPVHQFSIANIADVVIAYDNDLYHVAITPQGSNDDVMKFRMQGAKDALCLFATIKRLLQDDNPSAARGQREDQREPLEKQEGMDNEAFRLDNPLGVKRELLISFYQEFVKQVSLGKRETTVNVRKSRSTSQTLPDYENIDFSSVFLKHDIPKSTTQDVILCLWAGCVPYLFPEEEIPVCLVLTNINIFLFRVFLPERGREPARNLEDLRESLHCFYSFALCDVKEIVVGLYDQGFRIEVAEEGPRGTFAFLARDASKTADFLELFCRIVGIDDSTDGMDVRRRNTIVMDQFDLPSIVYPDEKKIDSLKNQLAAQDLSPFHDRENLISYNIVYDKSQDIASEKRRVSTDTPMTSIRTLILTNLRLFLCEEDYVHWPLPTYVRSLPITPEWVVDQVESVHSVIGIDLWEDHAQLNLTGRYGLAITFEDTICSLTVYSNSNVYSKTWNLMFESLCEREQFTRSLSCLWKNQFDQTLSITYSKTTARGVENSKSFPSSVDVCSFSDTPGQQGHHRVHSGNIVVPPSQPINTPEVLASLDRSRFLEFFRACICLDNERGNDVKYYMSAGCIPYNYKRVEMPAAVILTKKRFYLIVGEDNKEQLNGATPLADSSGASKLWMKTLRVKDLKQIAVGLFDQKFRVEGDKGSDTFTLVTRKFEKTNDFLQSLSQVLLAQSPEHDEASPVEKRRGNGEKPPSRPLREGCERGEYKGVLSGEEQESDGKDAQGANPMNSLEPSSATVMELTSKVVRLYRQDEESELAAKSEFIHPNSHVKFIYPSDETLDKLKDVIMNFIDISCPFSQTQGFGVLLYTLVFRRSSEGWLPCTLVISERFLCILNENHVDYPLPLFAKGLPDQQQYDVIDVRLLASIICVEFQELNSGDFTLNLGSAVEPAAYEDRFKTDMVEGDLCLVTDVNFESSSRRSKLELKAPSFTEREKIFHLVSKLWSNLFSGKNLPVIRKKNI